MGDFKCREEKTEFCRQISMQTSSSETLIWLEIWSNYMGPNGGSVAMDLELHASLTAR
jgi:hypothetical protein